MPYTRNDTPEIRARIDAELDHIVATLRDADPHLVSVILTGGFARGEGAVLDGKPQNDYDLLAVHAFGGSDVPYDDLRRRLEAELDMHLDIARVARARLRWVAPTIFWYETTMRGQVIWGENALRLLHVRSPHRLRRDEPMRLLVNRAAGILLAPDDPDARRLQASKAFLAVLDARLLMRGTFPPSQTERWHAFRKAVQAGTADSALVAMQDWFGWAYRRKTAPSTAQDVDAENAMRAAAAAILDTVPMALRHAGCEDLDAFAKHEGVVARVHYIRHAKDIPGAKRFAPHPTGSVRAATIRLLEAQLAGRGRDEPFAELFHDIPEDVTDALETLRDHTLQ